MNAVDATVILKQDPATSGIPIVVLTAMAFGEWKTKALKAGVAKYLIKPVPPPELTETVRTLISTAFPFNGEVSLSNQERLDYRRAANNPYSSRTTCRGSLSSLNPINFVIKLTYVKISGKGKILLCKTGSHFSGIYLSMVIPGKKIPKRVFALAGIPCASTSLYAKHSQKNFDR
jgi:hypothetical protein